MYMYMYCSLDSFVCCDVGGLGLRLQMETVHVTDIFTVYAARWMPPGLGEIRSTCLQYNPSLFMKAKVYL